MTDKNKNKKTFLILTITAYVVLAGAMIYKARQSPSSCPFVSMCSTPAPAAAALVETKEVNLNLPTFLELGSKNCVPCQMMEPILAAVREYATLGEICNILRKVFGEYRDKG